MRNQAKTTNDTIVWRDRIKGNLNFKYLTVLLAGLVPDTRLKLQQNYFILICQLKQKYFSVNLFCCFLKSLDTNELALAYKVIIFLCLFCWLFAINKIRI